jgi:hypothetical protein
MTKVPAPLMLPPPRLRGLSPRLGSLCSDSCEPLGSIVSDKSSSHLTLPLPPLRGMSPRSGRCVTTVSNLRVLAVLAKNPAPLMLPPLKPRGLSPDLGCVGTNGINLWAVSDLTGIAAELHYGAAPQLWLFWSRRASTIISVRLRQPTGRCLHRKSTQTPTMGLLNCRCSGSSSNCSSD